VEGDVFYGHRVGNNLSIGLSGAGIAWNYATLKETRLDTTSYFTCDATPYCIIYKGNNAKMSGPDDLAYSTSDKLFSMAGHNLIFGGSYATMQYPLTYSYAHTDTINSADVSLTTYHSEIDTYIYDGYGSVFLPGGMETEVGRIHTIAFARDSNRLKNTATRAEYYTWYKPGFHNPLMVIKYDTLVTHKPHVTYAAYYTDKANTTSEPDARLLASSLTVVQNITSNELHISFSLKHVLVSAIYITDLSGKVIATIKNDNYTDGLKDVVYPLDFLASGTYFIHLASSVGRISKQIVVNKG
jgi:hypothetical protein